MNVEKKSNYFLWIAAVLTLLACNSQNFLTRLSFAVDPYRIRGDALQFITNYWPAHSAECLQNDYTSGYYLNALIPPGHKFFFESMVKLINPIDLANYTGVALCFVFLLLLSLIARRLAGWPAVFITLLLATFMLSKTFIFSAAIPRPFGVVIVTAGVYALVEGRRYWLAALAMLGILIYPCSGALLGICFGIHSLRSLKGAVPDKTLAFRRVLIENSLLLSLLFVCALPMLLGGQGYGRSLTPAFADIYPETGEGGRYAPQDRGIQSRGFVGSLWNRSSSLIIANQGFPGAQHSIKESADNGSQLNVGKKKSKFPQKVRSVLLATLLLLSCLAILKKTGLRRNSSQEVRGFIDFILAVGLAYLLAILFFPRLYFPDRYLLMAAPVLSCCGISLLLIKAVELNFSGKVRQVFLILASASLIFITGMAQFKVHEKRSLEDLKPLLTHIQNLPAGTRLAGWPSGIINVIPYFTCKSALVTYETHQAFHEDYLLEMRRRMELLISVFSATSLEPLLKLKHDLGVTHLLIEDRYLHERLEYFKPFQVDLDLQRAGRLEEIESFYRKLAASTDFHWKGVRLIDLSKLPEPAH